MSGNQSDNVKKVNLAVDSLKNKAKLYAGLSNLNNKGIKDPVKSLIHPPAPGKKVSKVGWVLFWIPEPTMVSNAVGLPMVAAGKVLDRYYNGTTVKHVGEEARKTLYSLEEFL
ncbi:MAG: hypothetical protein ACE5J2_08605 [Nitrososphaerales archaeon]